MADAITADLCGQEKGNMNQDLGLCFFFPTRYMFLVYFKLDPLTFLIRKLCDRYRRDEMQDERMPSSDLNYQLCRLKLCSIREFIKSLPYAMRM